MSKKVKKCVKSFTKCVERILIFFSENLEFLHLELCNEQKKVKCTDTLKTAATSRDAALGPD